MYSQYSLFFLFGLQVLADFPVAKVQNVTFNATHGAINPTTAWARIQEAGLPQNLSEAVLTALNFERSNWPGTSVQLDPFYADLPLNWTHSPPGSIIKVEHVSNTSLYTIPPSLSLSRFIYTTKTLNGTLVPASAFVLWPYMARKFVVDCKGRGDSCDLPIVAWAHGTSGWSGECGPSHMRNLYYQFRIFATAEQGFVVVATDFAGLGLNQDDQGNFIPHQYLANPASGNDVLYAVKAAREAWDVLGKRYVIMGHSQGGGAAWGAAGVLAQNDSDIDDDLREGYLGTIAAAPHVSFGTTTRIQPNLQRLGLTLGWIATGIQSVFPTFTLSEWLTEKGVRIVELLQGIQGCQPVATELFTDYDLVRDDWNSSWYGDAFDKLTTNIAIPFAGPMLVIQGSADTSNPASATLGAVNATCDALDDANIEYVELEGVDHVPLMFASQQVYFGWISDRFEGKKVTRGCIRRSIKPVRPVEDLQSELNFFLEWSQYDYTS